MGSPTNLNRYKRWSEEELNFVKENSSSSAKYIAEQLGRSHKAVQRCRFAKDIKFIPLCNYCGKETEQYNISSFGSYCKEHQESGRIYSSYKAGAESRGINFNLPLDLFVEWYDTTSCHYCGERIPTIGIDRFDNSSGYDINNVVPCCKICNKMKSDLPLEKWVEHVYKIIQHLNIKEN
jgi:hypothetical protein